MGKIKFLTFFAIFTFSQNLLSQYYEITYEVIYQPNINDTIMVKDEYVLKCDLKKKESLFTSLNKENSLNISILKNFQKKEFIKYETILDNLYSIDYNFNQSNWTLTDTKKEILGYICNKAEINFGNRIWEAWFTSDIPFQDGPYKFSNLPGLIIEIRSLDGNYNFKAKGIQKNENINIKKLLATHFKNAEKEKTFKTEIINDPSSQYRKQMIQLKNNNIGISVRYEGKVITEKESEKFIEIEFSKWRSEHNNPIEKGYIWIR